MTMDIKLPLGLIFTVIGALLVISGVAFAEEVMRKFDINYNIIWGLVVTLFGVIMLMAHFKTRKRR
jgi:hypothetical protein